MTNDDEDRRIVDALLNATEHRTIEFKAARTRFDFDEAVDYCVAIANEHGGRLVFGITDETPHVACGTTVFRDLAQFEHQVYQRVKLNVVTRELHYDGIRVVQVQIPSRRRGEPLSHRGKYLMRSGSSLTAMDNRTLAAIFAESREPQELVPVVEHLTATDAFELLDVPAFFRMTGRRAAASLDEQLAVLGNHRLVVQEGDRWSITTAGGLLLARALDDFPDLAMRRVRILRYSGGGRINTVLDQFETRGYALGFEAITQMITAQLPSQETIGADRRVTSSLYPPRSLREFLVNALVHQDLEEHAGQLLVEVFDDRLELRNPGLPTINVERFVDDTNQRNMRIADAMRLVGLAEARGSGVDRALQDIETSLLRAPQFQTQTAATVVTLRGRLDVSEMTDEEKVWTVFLHCCLRYSQHDRLTNGSMRARLGLPDSKASQTSGLISAAVDAGMIKLDPRSGNSRRHAAYLPFFAPE